MIITCPNCSARYDVDVARFTPDGRSVRCAECDESWFVPAPEPIEDLVPLNAKRNDDASKSDEARRDDDRRAETADEPSRRSARYRVAAEADDDEDDDRLFAGPSRKFGARDALRADRDDDDHDRRGERSRRFNRPDETDRDRAGRRDFRDPRHKVRDEDVSLDRDERRYEDDDRDARRRPDNRDKGDRHHSDRYEGRSDHDAGSRRGYDDRRPSVVDADFEDVGGRDDAGGFTHAPDDDDEFAPERGFGRRVREERRRSTALARIEDLDPLAEQVFSEEFFKALKVQPKELERALRKARRKAEAREKNRLTPLRALGWSAWIGAIAASVFVAVTYRERIVALFPGAATAYEAVGIDANPYGVKIEGVTHRLAVSQAGPTIEIIGRLKNETKGSLTAPTLQAEALDAAGGLLARWTFEARDSAIPAGESVDFHTRAAAPEGVKEVTLSFAPPEGARVTLDGVDPLN